MHLKQPGFTYSACGPFTKHHERTQRFGETGNFKHLYRNELDKTCFAHDAAYSESNDLTKIIILDSFLKDRADEIARNLGYDAYQKTLASMLYLVFDKKTGSGISGNEELAEELHKFYARLKDNICATDLAEMESFSSKNKNVKYLLCVVNVFTKYICVKHLKDKKGKTI